jgi:putative ABC transport system permease protein
MKYGGLMLANLFRKKTRLALTLGSFAVALFLFGILAAVKGAFNQAIDIAKADRLVVINRVSLIQPLPLSYVDRILRIPGVKALTHDNWFGGIYQDERNFFGQFAIDDENQRKVFPEFIIAADQWATFMKDRQGAIAGINTAKRFGWKVGDRIPIKGTIIPGAHEFNLDGIYQGKTAGADETQFWFHWTYYDEHAPAALKGFPGWFFVQLENPDDAARISKAIDDEFANSPYETRTETEKTFGANWVKQFGNIEFLILTIGSVVFFTLLLVTGNTMAIAVRERTAELAVLKAVGYSDRLVMIFVLLESLIIALIGGAVGVGGAKLVTLVWHPVPNIMPYFVVPWGALLTGLALSLAIGAASGIMPAAGAMRLRVVDALRRV